MAGAPIGGRDDRGGSVHGDLSHPSTAAANWYGSRQLGFDLRIWDAGGPPRRLPAG